MADGGSDGVPKAGKVGHALEAGLCVPLQWVEAQNIEDDFVPLFGRHEGLFADFLKFHPGVEIIWIETDGVQIICLCFIVTLLFSAKITEKIVDLRLVRTFGSELGENFFGDALGAFAVEGLFAAEAVAFYAAKTV